MKNINQTLLLFSTQILLLFYAPVTIVRGHYDLPLSVRLSDRPFVTLNGIEFV